MPDVVRRISGPAVPPRYAAAVDQIRAMAAHPGVELRVAWIEELAPARPQADRQAAA